MKFSIKHEIKGPYPGTYESEAYDIPPGGHSSVLPDQPERGNAGKGL